MGWCTRPAAAPLLPRPQEPARVFTPDFGVALGLYIGMLWVSERHIVAHFGARPDHIAIEKNMSWGRRLSAPAGVALLLWSGTLVAEHISRALV